MKREKIYCWLILFVMAGSLLAACKQRLNERITLWKNDKIPYGTWYAFENLQYLFPLAAIHVNKRSPDDGKQSASKGREGPSIADYQENKSAYIIIAPEVFPDEAETSALLKLVGTGHHVFISAFRVSKELLDSMHLYADEFAPFYNNRDSLSLTVEEPVEHVVHSYRYPGKSMDNYFNRMDSTITTVVGRDHRGRPDFVLFNYDGGGSFLIHLAPMAFTNFFLLHKNNNDYYEQVLSYLPKNISVLYWDDYFRNNSRNRNSGNDFSALGWVMKQPGLKEAIWLIILLLVLVYLFESKRRQRIIPVIEPLRNASLDFVKTIGRLYYQRRDNRNLARKMKAHFLDHVRSRYNIQTSSLDDNLVQRLSNKSGYEQQAVHQLVFALKAAEELPELSDDELMELNDKLENFQKHTT